MNLLASYSQERFLVRSLMEGLTDAVHAEINVSKLLHLAGMPCHLWSCPICRPKMLVCLASRVAAILICSIRPFGGMSLSELPPACRCRHSQI